MGVLIRIGVAVIVFVIVVLLLLPMTFAALEVPLSGPVYAILKLVAGLIALIYIWRGPTPGWKPAP